ncbi:MAG: GNAT family N-acetyltransferase [Acidimicrobiales bacterium]
MTILTQDTDLRVRKVGAEHRDAVAAAITAGFFDDPVTVWLLPDECRRAEILEPLFRLYVDAYIPHDELYLAADGAGTAVWLPPGHKLLSPEGEEAYGAKVVEIAGPDADRLFQLEETFAVYHPMAPHYYPNFVSVAPWAQGRGIGTALLRTVLDRADEEGVPSYLESTSPRNRRLYERLGYVCQGEFTLPDGGPRLSQMWREPQV